MVHVRQQDQFCIWIGAGKQPCISFVDLEIALTSKDKNGVRVATQKRGWIETKCIDQEPLNLRPKQWQ